MIIHRILGAHGILPGINRSGARCRCQEKGVSCRYGHAAGSGCSLRDVVQRHAVLQCNGCSILCIAGKLEVPCLITPVRCRIDSRPGERIQLHLARIRKLLQVCDNVFDQRLRLVGKMSAKRICIDISQRVMGDTVIIRVIGTPPVGHLGLNVNPTDGISERRSTVHIKQALSEQLFISAAVQIHIILIGRIGRRRGKRRLQAEGLYFLCNTVHTVADVFHMVIGLLVDQGRAQRIRTALSGEVILICLDLSRFIPVLIIVSRRRSQEHPRHLDGFLTDLDSFFCFRSVSNGYHNVNVLIRHHESVTALIFLISHIKIVALRSLLIGNSSGKLRGHTADINISGRRNGKPYGFTGCIRSILVIECHSVRLRNRNMDRMRALFLCSFLRFHLCLGFHCFRHILGVCKAFTARLF